MELIPMKSFDRGYAPLQRQINRLFDDLLGDGDWSHMLSRGGSFTPPLDLAETEKEILISVEVPGVDPKEIDISVTGNTLTLKGEKSSESEESGKSWQRIERTYGRFSRSVALPGTVDSSRVTAKSKDGILEIRLAKKEEALPKKIEVSVG